MPRLLAADGPGIGATVAVIAAAVVVLSVVALVLRRRLIAGRGGSFELGHRVLATDAEPGGWVLGMGRYSGDLLECYRLFSLSPRPLLILDRGDLTYAGQRPPGEAEARTLFAGHTVVACHSSAGTHELAMSPDAVTGFVAWLQAAPPGSQPRPV